MARRIGDDGEQQQAQFAIVEQASAVAAASARTMVPAAVVGTRTVVGR